MSVDTYLLPHRGPTFGGVGTLFSPLGHERPGGGVNRQGVVLTYLLSLDIDSQ